MCEGDMVAEKVKDALHVREAERVTEPDRDTVGVGSQVGVAL